MELHPDEGRPCADINQGAMPAVLPFLVMHGGYSYAEVPRILVGGALSGPHG